MYDSKVMRLINKCKWYKVHVWNEDSNDPNPNPRTPVADIDDANVVSSECMDVPDFVMEKHHRILLDLDIPAYLVPSSTPGHSHLYIDRALPEKDYFELLDYLAKLQIIDVGYAEASKARGGSYLRLPWVKKEVDNQ